jgi:transmembrane sensor
MEDNINMQDPNDRKWYLASKVLSDQLNEQERIEWESITKDAKFLNEFQRVEKYWLSMGTLPYQQINKEKDWQKVLEKVKEHRTTISPDFFGSRWLRYAAAVVFLILVSVFVVSKVNNKQTPSLLTSIVAPPGSKTLVTLPDSSKVWLNAESKVSFDAHFGNEHRALNLEGEAFFDVVKSSVPFVVHTELYDVSVLGTAFNVKSYKDDETVSTTLVRGSVKIVYIDSSGQSEEVLLHPNEKITIAKNTSATRLTTYEIEKGIDADLEAGWKDGWLTVSGESLKELARKMERLYDVEVKFSTAQLESYRYTGRIKQLSLEQVLKALALTSPVEFEVSGKTVTLSENKTEKSKYSTEPAN